MERGKRTFKLAVQKSCKKWFINSRHELATVGGLLCENIPFKLRKLARVRMRCGWFERAKSGLVFLALHNSMLCTA